ncbi:twin-arginine translocation pathway signal [Mangrovicella endophytica]|uniref:twin-arginine translocation pathway signal n=1 Tax=Mangrovicella endophytica TaxID=2066697 RepID=UPI000C9E449E|nr:twin-arginine translocation pathway signal [Mangrovicella endophytica]
MKKRAGICLIGLASALGLTFSIGAHAAPTQPVAAASDTTAPIVFVPGDGDGRGFWMTQIWRFEVNGYPSDRLFSVAIPHPVARTDDAVEEVNRSSTAEAADAVRTAVDDALAVSAPGAKAVIVASGRGCQTARNYVRNGGGAAKVARMVLAGCTHKGLFVDPADRLGSEYNGAGAFLTALNAPPEVPAGIPVTVIRSDAADLYAQPDGRFAGRPGAATGLSFDGQELKGAETVVLPGADGRETATSLEAFIAIYKAVTGTPPGKVALLPEDQPVLSGAITGWENGAPTNLGLPGAQLTIHAVDPLTGERIGKPVLDEKAGPNGEWGPFTALPGQTYEFVVTAAGYPLTRIYRSPFPRSSRVVDLRLFPAAAATVNGAVLAGETVGIMRPLGYFGVDDTALVDGQPLAGRPAGDPAPSVWISAVAVPGPARSVEANFALEAIAAQTTPQDPADVAWIEFTD